MNIRTLVLLVILAIVCPPITGGAVGFHTPFGSSGGGGTASEVTFDNTKASIPNDPDTVQKMGEELKTLIDNVGTTGVNFSAMAATTDTTGIDSRQMILENSGTVNKITWANIISAIKASLAGFFQPDDADLDSLSSGITGPVLGLGDGSGYQALQLASELALTGTTLGLNATLDLSGYTITFGLEATDIPDLSATYQAADTELAAIAALANGAGVLTNDGAGNMSWGAGGSFDISALPENVTTTGIDAYTMPIDNSGTSYKMTWAYIIKAIRAALGLGEAVDGENYIEVSNNTSREPDAGTNQLYPEGNVWKMNSNGVEDTIVGASDLVSIEDSMGTLRTDVDTALAGSGTMIYPDAGIAVSTGAAWGSSLTAPSGTIVGTSDEQTLTNKTLDANGTGNVLKGYGYMTFTRPHSFGAGVTQQTTATKRLYGQALFANATDEATNFVEYQAVVPPDIDTAVDLYAEFQFLISEADTMGHDYQISMISIGNSEPNSGSPTNTVALSYTTDASGAQGDLETASATLTDWKSNMTAGEKIIIRVARDGDDATNDASTVDSYSDNLLIRYGFTQ